MVCPECGHEVPDGERICSACGAALPDMEDSKPESDGTRSPVPATDMPTVTAYDLSADQELPTVERKRIRLRWPLFVGVPVFGLVIAAVFAYLAIFSSTPLYSLVPKDSPVLVSADAKWWWDSLKDVREIPSVRQSLKDAERESGASFDRDVAPWIGQVNLAVLGVRPNGLGSQMAVYAEIRNPLKFAQACKRLQAGIAQSNGYTWTSKKYDGVEIRQAKSKGGFGGSPEMSFAVMHRWVVLGFGDGAMEKVIECWKGRTKSVASVEAWRSATGRLPGRSVLSMVMDGRAYMKMISSGSMFQVPKRAAEMASSVCSANMTVDGDNIRMESIAVSTSETVRRYWKQMHGTSGPVSGKALKAIPSGAMIAMAMVDPGKCVTKLKQMMLDAQPGPEARAQAEVAFKGAEPILAALNKMTGECAVSVNWREGKGFGATFVGGTPSPETAGHVGRDLAKYAQSEGARVETKGATYDLPDLATRDTEITILPSWEAKGSNFVAASNHDWLADSGGAKGLDLPSEASGSDAAMVVDLRSLPELLNSIEKQGAPKDAVDTVRKLDLSKVHIVAWAKIDPEGKSYRSSTSIRGLDWRKAIKVAVEAASRYAPSYPSAYGPSPAAAPAQAADIERAIAATTAKSPPQRH